MGNRIILNPTSYFGRGSRKDIIEELKEKKLDKAFVVTDKPLIEAGVTKLVTDVLDNANFSYEIFDNIKPNPTVENVQEGIDRCRESETDVIIAVGGGSVIDTAKAISVVMRNPEHYDIVSLDGVGKTRNQGMPIIAVPTTSGTAAEVTINYVITDTKNLKKMVCVDPHDIPIVSIIDQDLMEKMPKSLAASTGMDALTHAMEGYTTRAAWLIPDMFHLNAMALIFKNLDKAVNQKDRKAIDNIGYGQYIAGMGFSNVGLGIVHSMAHSLGAYYDTPHGLANALLLPHVLRFNGKICPELFRNMGRAIGLSMENLSDEEAVNKVADAVKNLAIKVGIPQTLKEIGIRKEDLPKLAHQALNDVCTGGNPRKVTESDILSLYEKAYE
ncbi:MAG: lactaldehyde reductase [Bacilli bacterium]|nr:lactaldehyde reductase [Bacilli bacterium]